MSLVYSDVYIKLRVICYHWFFSNDATANMSKKTVLRFTTKELNTLVNNADAHVKLITSRRKISLHPNCLNDVKTSVHEVLGERLAKFDDQLKGILLSYKNIKVLKNFAKVLHDDPYLYVTIRADFYVFMPEVGCTLFGIVNKKSPDHIGCLVHKVFNVALPRPESDTEEEWQGFYAEHGQTVTFTVEYIDLRGSLPYIRGRLLDIGINHKYEENSNNGGSEDAEDNEEGILSTSQNIKDLVNSAASNFMVDKKLKKRKMKEEIKFDCSDLPERVSDNFSSSQSFILDETGKKVRSKKNTKGNSSQSNEFELYNNDVDQQNYISCKAKDKGSKKMNMTMTDFENIYKTLPNTMDEENSSNKIKKKKHRSSIKQECALINDVIAHNSEMDESSEVEGQNIASPKTGESGISLGSKTKKKKKKKKDDAMFEADESILTTENSQQRSNMMTAKEGVSLKHSTYSIMSDDLKGIATSTPNEQKGFQKFISNLSEIKQGFSIEESETPKGIKLSKRQKVKKMTSIEKDLGNLANTNVDDYCNKIGTGAEVIVKPIKKENIKEANDGNVSPSSSSGSPGKRRVIKSKEQKKSASMSEACNLLLENMLNKFNSTTQASICDTKKKEPDSSQNYKSPKKRNLSLSNIAGETLRAMERDNSSSPSSENETDEGSGTQNNKILHDSEEPMVKLKKKKSKTEITNTANSITIKFNERSPRNAKNKHNTPDLAIGNSIETKQSPSHSQKSPKKNKNQVCGLEAFAESDDKANKVKQKKKSDVISWELPDSLMEIQNNILQKLKLEMSPEKDKILKSEMSPAKEKNRKSEMSPVKEKKIKSEMSPVTDKKLKRKRHSVDGTRNDDTDKSSIRKVAKLDSASEIAGGHKEPNERVTIPDSSIKGHGIQHKKIKSSNADETETEKLDTTIENEKEALLHKMLSSIAGVIKLEGANEVKISKEAKKERKKSKHITETQINNKNVLIQSSVVPLENLNFQQKYKDVNPVIKQDEKCEVTINQQEFKKKKKKKKDKDKPFSGDGNVTDNISNTKDGNVSLNNNISNDNTIEREVAKKVNSKKPKKKGQTALMSNYDHNETVTELNKIAKLNSKVGKSLEVGNVTFENTKKSKLKAGKEINQIHNQLNIDELDSKISCVEILKKTGHIGHKKEKGKKDKTKKNDDKVGQAETKEPDHRKQEKRHSVTSREEDESPAALAERLLQEFLQRKVK